MKKKRDEEAGAAHRMAAALGGACHSVFAVRSTGSRALSEEVPVTEMEGRETTKYDGGSTALEFNWLDPDGAIAANSVCLLFYSKNTILLWNDTT